MTVACKKWWLHVTLNRNFKHEKMYKNISDEIGKMASVRKCADYSILPMAGSSSKMDSVANKDFGTHNVTINTTEMMMMGGVCKTHLFVLLNRENDENLGDYVYHGCTALKRRGILGKNMNFGKLTGMAEQSSTVIHKVGKAAIGLHEESLGEGDSGGGGK